MEGQPWLYAGSVSAFTRAVMVVMWSLVQKCPYMTYNHKYVHGSFCASGLCHHFRLRDEASRCRAGFHTCWSIALVHLVTWIATKNTKFLSQNTTFVSSEESLL